jgi:hypothetical protein
MPQPGQPGQPQPQGQETEQQEGDNGDIGQMISDVHTEMSKIGQLLSMSDLPKETQQEYAGILQSFRSFFEKLSSGGAPAGQPGQAPEKGMPAAPTDMNAGPGAMPMGMMGARQ